MARAPSYGAREYCSDHSRWKVVAIPSRYRRSGLVPAAPAIAGSVTKLWPSCSAWSISNLSSATNHRFGSFVLKRRRIVGHGDRGRDGGSDNIVSSRFEALVYPLLDVLVEQEPHRTGLVERSIVCSPAVRSAANAGQARIDSRGQGRFGFHLMRGYSGRKPEESEVLTWMTSCSRLRRRTPD